MMKKITWKRIKVKMIGDGTIENSLRPNLPTYMIDIERDANGKPVLDGDGNEQDTVDYTRKECYVLIPEDETKNVNGKTVLNEDRIRVKYKQWKDFKASDVEVIK